MHCARTLRIAAALLFAVALTAGCGNKDAAPAADDDSATMDNPLAMYAGDWMAEAYVGDAEEPATVTLVKASEDGAEWAMRFTHLDEDVPANNVFLKGDSVVSTWGPFPSAVREGLTVEEMTTYLIMAGEGLAGRAVATYSDGEVVSFRLAAEAVE